MEKKKGLFEERVSSIWAIWGHAHEKTAGQMRSNRKLTRTGARNSKSRLVLIPIFKRFKITIKNGEMIGKNTADHVVKGNKVNSEKMVYEG